MILHKIKNSPYAKTAIVASCLMALYGFVPIVLFVQPPLTIVLIALIALFVGFLIVWAINITVFEVFKKYHAILKYILSYIFAMSFIIAVGLIVFQFWERPNNRFPIPFYPAFTINTLILILMNQVNLSIKKDAIEYRLNESRIKQLEAEKQLLSQQLQPHFLFNALSTLKSFIKVNPAKSEKYIVKLAEFLRFSLDANRDQLTTLNKEIAFVKDYLDLQQLRFGEALQCEIDIDTNVIDKKLPVFAIQTLIENAIKHNAFTIRNPLYIRIMSNVEWIIVSNNLIPKVDKSNSTSTGLKNLEKRYQLIDSRFIEIESDELHFQVSIPLFQANYEKNA